jgi:hypothetical protein
VQERELASIFQKLRRDIVPRSVDETQVVRLVGEYSKAKTFDYLNFLQFRRKKKIRRKIDNTFWIELQGDIWIVESYIQTSEGVCKGVDPNHWI